MLPKIDVPIYSVKLISNGEIVKFRPFTVKEEKLFLMANESEDMDAIVDATKQVLNNCIITDSIKIDDLPIFDIEYLFLNIRARSISEVVNLKYKCNNDIKDVEGEGTHKCNASVEIDVNVLDIKPKIDKKENNKIAISDKLGIMMKYPTFDILKKYDISNQADVIIEMTVSCIDYIYDEEQLYYAKDTSNAELVEFVESLQTKDLEKIKLFFDNMPKLSKDLEFKCNKCGYEEKIKLEGLQNFFV
jgi:hypothetical protein